MTPNGETEETLNKMLRLIQDRPPLPKHKPTPNIPPLPKKKPLSLEQKIQLIKEKAGLVKKAYNFFKKRNPVGFMKELSERTSKDIDKKRNDPL